MQITDVAEQLGLVAFAVSGAFAAIRHRFDMVGVVALSTVTAVGGGAIRDVLLGETPAVFLLRVSYILVPLITGLVMMPSHSWIDSRLRTPVLVFDAVGLGLFCVTGALKAANAPITAIGAIGLGVITATGGGVIRDLFSGERPVMFRSDSVLYSIPAAAGATVIVLAERRGWQPPLLAPVVAAAVCAVRLAALRFGWRAPRPL